MTIRGVTVQTHGAVDIHQFSTAWTTPKNFGIGDKLIKSQLFDLFEVFDQTLTVIGRITLVEGFQALTRIFCTGVTEFGRIPALFRAIDDDTFGTG